jgi:GNAT superfamily N-acetyltransferase
MVRDLLRVSGEPVPSATSLEHEVRSLTLSVAEVEGRPAGVVTASDEFEHREAGHSWRCHGTALYVRRLVVSPEYRRAGVGSQLLAHVENQARRLRYAAVRLRESHGERLARSFCSSWGYTRIGPARTEEAGVYWYERTTRAQGGGR